MEIEEVETEICPKIVENLWEFLSACVFVRARALAVKMLKWQKKTIATQENYVFARTTHMRAYTNVRKFQIGIARR